MTKDSRPADIRSLSALLSGSSLAALGIGLFAFTVPLVSLDERISGAWLGSAFAAYYLARLLASPLSGLAADRYGPRLPLAISFGMGALIPLLYFLFPAMKTLYAIQVALGIVSGLVKPVTMAALGLPASGATLSRRFAIHAALLNGTMFIGPLLGGVLYFDRTMPPVLLGLSACMGLAATVTLLMPKGGSTVRTEPDHGDTAKPSPDIFRAAALFMAIFGRTLGIGLVAAFYPIVLTTVLGAPPVTAALAFGVPGLAAFLGLTLMSRQAPDDTGPNRTLAGMLLSAGALFGLGGCSTLWQFMITGALMGMGAALSIPASMALASSLSRRQGAVFGAANLAAGLGFLFGPLLGGLAVHAFHSPQPALQLAGVAGMLACLPLGVWVAREKYHWGRLTARMGAAALAIFLVTVGLLLPTPQEKPDTTDGLYRFTDIAMGTVVNLTLEASSRKAATDAAQKTLAAMRALQADFDHRNPEGSVGRINREAGNAWVTPTPRAFALLERAMTLSEITEGVFDPTVGALTTSPLYFAMDETLAKAKADLVNYRLIRLDRTGKRVRLDRQGMALDLGGIAKGTVIDAAVAMLRRLGIHAGIVEAGGDFYCFGDRNWTVGIRHPRNSTIFKTISVREKGVCGSGDYQQFIMADNEGRKERKHHIIDPATMESAAVSIGVTVIAENAEQADGLATTLFIMGPARGKEFLSEYAPNDSAIWFLPDESVTTSRGFPDSP